MKPFKDSLLKTHPGEKNYEDRRSYLKTVKDILTKFTANMNFGRPGTPSISVLDFVKHTVTDLMLNADDALKKSQTPSYMVHSTSESEMSDNGSNSTRIRNFQLAIDEYIGLGPKKSSLHKSFVQARDIIYII